MDTTLISVVMQGGFAGLFIWLLMNTQKTAENREARLLAALDKFAEAATKQTVTLDRIERAIQDLAKSDKDETG